MAVRFVGTRRSDRSSENRAAGVRRAGRSVGHHRAHAVPLPPRRRVVRWLEAIGYNLLADPTVEGVVVNSRDVTERQRGEEALRP